MSCAVNSRSLHFGVLSALSKDGGRQFGITFVSSIDYYLALTQNLETLSLIMELSWTIVSCQEQDTTQAAGRSAAPGNEKGPSQIGMMGAGQEEVSATLDSLDFGGSHDNSKTR